MILLPPEEYEDSGHGRVAFYPICFLGKWRQILVVVTRVVWQANEQPPTVHTTSFFLSKLIAQQLFPEHIGEFKDLED